MGLRASFVVAFLIASLVIAPLVDDLLARRRVQVVG